MKNFEIKYFFFFQTLPAIIYDIALIFLTFNCHFSESISQSALIFQRIVEMVVIAHVQYFVRVNLRANKMKSPTILSAISCFLITITTIYLRWCCMVMKSMQNQCPMIDIWKVLPDFFGEVLAENQRKLSFPSFASFIYVLLRLIICNKLGQWTSFLLAYASKVLVDDRNFPPS